MSSWRERWQDLWRFLNTPLFTSPTPGTSNPNTEAISPESLAIWLEILEAKKRGLSGKAVYPIFQKYQDQLDLDFAETLRQWFHSQLDPDDIEKNKDLARNLNNFAIDIQNFPLGSRANNLEIAIVAYQAALDVYTRSAFPEDWAKTQMNLGTAYQTRIRGERADNIEEAIRRFQAALEVTTRTAFPEDWARTQMNSGNAYQTRIPGERANNIEEAIRCYQAALDVYSRSAFPYEWATTQNNLAIAYRNRIRGERADNIEEAIRRYQATLEVRTRTAFPEDWARTQMNLGNAYSDRIRGERADNIEEAIRRFQAALEVTTRSAFPEDWARTQMNLGNAYSDRIRGERADNIEEAIRRFQAALEVTTRSAFPEDWAMTQENLAYAYINLNEPVAVFQYFKASLEIFTPSSFPLNCLKAGRNLGNFAYNLQNWEIAIEGYDNAIRAVEQSRDWATSPHTKRKILEDALPIYGKMIHACLHLEGYQQALLTVERSKSRTLMEMLASADLVPKNATPQQQDQYRQLNREIAALQQSFAPTETPADGQTETPEAGERRGHPDIATATDAAGTPQLKHLLQQRDRLLAQINDPDFNLLQNVRPQLPDFRQLLTPETALIEWYLPQDSDLGAWAFTVTLDPDGPYIRAHSYSPQQRQTLDQFNQTYFADYRQPSWDQSLDRRLEDLAEHLHLSGLIAALPPTCQRLILIPHLYLHLFPLHALSVELSVELKAPATPLLERFSQGVSYAPSCQILDYIHHRPQAATPPQFFAVQNPTQDLDYAQMEVEFIRPYFDPNCYILSQEAATKSALNRRETLDKLRQSHVIHFACHGGFDSENPLNSAVVLAGDAPLASAPRGDQRQTLTLRDGRRFDTAQQGLTLGEIYRNLDIPACRLVMLSACETGLMGSLLTDEYIGLASGFLYAGTPAVVSSLWCVDDFATACLAIRFYYELRQDERVVMALHRTQNWLRQVSVAGFLDWCRQGLTMTEEECEIIEFKLMDYDEDCPFGQRRYWSAFVAVGL